MGETSDVIARLEAGKLGPNQLDAVQARMWPTAWDTPGHLHIVFNALKKGIQSLPEWPSLEQHFRSLATFLSRRGLRRRFVELCCRHDIRRGKVMQQWTGGTFTWRWEKLYVFLHQLKRRFFVLSTNWNADLMSRGQADAEDDEETRGRIIWPAGLLLLHHLHGTASCHYAHQHCEASNTHGKTHHDTNIQPMCVLLRRSKNMSAVGVKQE